MIAALPWSGAAPPPSADCLPSLAAACSARATPPAAIRSHRLAALMPAGREAELWGVSLFAQVSLTWLPSIVFTALNEAFGGDMSFAIASLGIFFLLSFIGVATVTEPSQLAQPIHAVSAVPEGDTSPMPGKAANGGGAQASTMPMPSWEAASRMLRQC